jgi:outer membrane protein TolC
MALMTKRLFHCISQRWVAGLLISATGCASVPVQKDAADHRPAARRVAAELVEAKHSGNEQSVAKLRASQDSSKPSFVELDGSTSKIPDRDSALRGARPDGVVAASNVISADSADTPHEVLPAAGQSDLSDQDDEGQSPSAAPAGAYVLSIGNVLHLADAQNPNVAMARERINEAYARVERAETLWLPSLRAGLNYNHHEGSIQDVAGKVFNTTRSSFYGGMGANAVGAGSPAVPGVVAQFHLTDAIFQPKIATHQAAARQFGATATRNDTLRDAAVAYLELVRAEHALAIAQETLNNTEKLANLTRQYAETGQGLASDHQRSEAELALRQEELVVRHEAIQVNSARLAQILHADPSVIIVSGEPAVVPLDIMTLDGSAASYVATGLSRRPELAEQSHLVCEAVERLRREKYAPLVPSVLLGMSYGGMGGGLGTAIVNTNDRWDADAAAYWEIRNLGFGERAARNETSSLQQQAQMRQLVILDRVAREVTEAHVQVTQRQQRIELAKRGVTAAEKSYTLNVQRIENAQGLPIEVLQAIQALATAQRSYLNAVVDYNVAQFELCRATGWFLEE